MALPFPAAGAPGATPPPRPTGAVAGGPPGPGAPLPMTVGAGAGNEAAADQQVSAIMPTLHKVLTAYQLGSKKYQAVLGAIKALTPTFSRTENQSMVPAALLQMSQAARQGPSAGAPSPGLASAPLPGMPPEQKPITGPMAA